MTMVDPSFSFEDLEAWIRRLRRFHREGARFERCAIERGSGETTIEAVALIVRMPHVPTKVIRKGVIELMKGMS